MAKEKKKGGGSTLIQDPNKCSSLSDVCTDTLKYNVVKYMIFITNAL